MVYQNPEAAESQDGAVKESIVLSRIRMLEKGEGRKPAGNAALSTRKNVHPFNRYHNTFDKNKHDKTQEKQPASSEVSEKRDTDPSHRASQMAYRDVVGANRTSPTKTARRLPVISTDESHLAQIRNSSPRNDGGSPLRRDDTLLPANVKKDFSNHRQRSVSPRVRVGPLAHLAMPVPPKPEDPSRTHAQANEASRDTENPVIATQDKMLKIQENGPTTGETSRGTPDEFRVAKSKLPTRVAAHFSPKASGAKKQEEVPSKDFVANQKRAISPVGTRLSLQRHHWDKRNHGSTDSNSLVENKNQAKEVNVSSPDPLRNADVKRAKDPSPINANRPLSKPEPEPGISFKRSPKSKVTMTQVRRKIPPSPKGYTSKSILEKVNLERNLKAAAVVLNEEKTSNVGSSSSSGRSSLSQAELGGIALKALKLSQAKTKLENSPLHHILSADRNNKQSTKEPATKAASQVTNPFAYSSAQRLSERFTRAERFTALKKARNAAQNGPKHRDAPPSPVPLEKSTHPVFGYTKSNVYVNVAAASEDVSIASPQPSCVRRSKHLSRALQHKANQFALASPSRRMNSNSSGTKVAGDSRDGQYQQRYHDQLFASQQEPKKIRGYDPLGLQNTHWAKVEKNHYYGGLKPSMDERTMSRHVHKVNVQSSSYTHPQAVNESARMPQSRDPPQQTVLSQKKNNQRSSGKQYFESSHRDNNGEDAYYYDERPEPHARQPRVNYRQVDNSRFRIEHHDTVSPSGTDFDFGTSGSMQGASSTDGEMFYEVSDKEASPRQAPTSRVLSNSIRPDQRGDVNTSKNRSMQHDTTTQNYVYNQSTSNTPGHFQYPNETPGPGCDNTFTGSLNKFVENETPRTFTNNTYAGSLNKPIVLKESSDSSAARPDAFHWLHRKYGNKAPVISDVTKHGVQGASLERRRPSPEKKKRAPERQQLGNEEDDVFFGLDDAYSVEDHRKAEALHSPKSGHVSKTETNNFYVRNFEANDDENSEANEPFSRSPEKNIGADITTTLNTGKDHVKRYRPNPVETVVEDSCGSPSYQENDDRDEPYGDEEELGQDENRPPASVLKNLGSVIVQSIQRACAIPVKYVEELPDLASCAMTTKMKCEEKISEAWVGLGDEDDVPKHSGSNNEASETTDRADTVTASLRDGPNENDERTQATDASSEPPTKDQQINRRNEAQTQLLHHAAKAMSFFGSSNIDNNITSSTDSSTTQGPKPLPSELASPISKVSETLSVDQRLVLQTFSTCLKSGGVEVLKLSRWNKWQLRYLTVSREVIQLGFDNDTPSTAFPQALLWLKQLGKSPKSRSVSSIKENGRGGLLFENLNHVIPIESNEYYDRNLPKRLKSKFPEFAGVLVDCRFPAGDRHVHFCFKTKQDAQSFITTMMIIKEVGNRQAEAEVRKDETEAQLTSYPTASAETKSIDS